MLKCDEVTKEARTLHISCQKLKHYNPMMIKIFVIKDDVMPSFSAAGFFKIRKTAIFSMLSSVTTFVIVLFQLKSLIKELEAFQPT